MQPNLALAAQVIYLKIFFSYLHDFRSKFPYIILVKRQILKLQKILQKINLSDINNIFKSKYLSELCKQKFK